MGLQLDGGKFWSEAHPEERKRYTGLAYAGKGAYAVVAKVYDSQANEHVAIKRIAEVFYDENEAKKVLREIRLLRDARHPNIIALRGLIRPASMEDFDTLYFVFEWMDGDLRQRIKSGDEMPARTVQSYLAQLLSAMAHVHSVGAIHRDCKPANIFVSRDGRTLKLGDFGLARAAGPRRWDRAGEEHERHGGAGDSAAAPRPPPLKRGMTAYVVTRWYRAPEVILQEPYSSAIDVWSVGCIFKELIELQPSSTSATGALFPGRYCLPFSFDDDDSQQQRQRHDQLSVIFRVLGPPTKPELAAFSRESRREVKELCGGWDRRAPQPREEQRKSLLGRACGGASPAEIDLLAALLRLAPHTRPSAAAALREHPYFASLPPEQRPPPTLPTGEAEVGNSFAFEAEDLNTNDLRILIANDIFRSRQLEDAPGSSPASVAKDAAGAEAAAHARPIRELEPTHTRCNT